MGYRDLEEDEDDLIKRKQSEAAFIQKVADNFSIRVVGLRVSPPENTRTKFKTFKKLVEPIQEAKTIAQMYEIVNEIASSRVVRENFVRNPTFTVEVDDRYEVPSNLENVPVVVTVKIPKEKPYNISANMTTSPKGANIEGSLVLERPNAFGNFESLSANLKVNNKGTGKFPLSFFLGFSKPLSFFQYRDFSIKAGSQQEDFTHWRLNSHNLKLSLNDENSVKGSSLEYCIAARDYTINKTTPMTTRGHPHFTIKSSVTYTLRKDFRNNKIFPTNGNLTSHIFEVAGLGGDSRFFKYDGSAEFYKTINNAVLGVGLKAGAVAPLGSSPLHFIDKCYFKEGALTCFDTNSQNPDGGHYCGTATVQLAVPVERFALLARVYGNVGCLGNVEMDQSVGQNFDAFKKSTRASLGVGITKSFDNGLLVNFTWGFPLVRQQKDTFSWFNISLGNTLS